jgi:trk system potassium uptake protein TrkA
VPVKDLKLPQGILIAAIDRNHEIIIPRGDTVCEVGDEVLVLGDPKALALFEKRVGVRATSVRSVVMFGTSGVVVQVCAALKRLKAEMRVIVPSRDDAEELAGRLDGPVVLHGDGTDVEFLREEHVGDADAFLGLSDHDEQNLMSCLLAKNLGAKRTAALVHKPDYVTLYEQLGVDVAISPRLLCANSILSFVRSGNVRTIATIEEGKAEVIELEIPAGSKLVGRKLFEAGFPRGSVVGAIARDNGDIVIPGGEDAIEARDRLVIFVLNEVVDKVTALAS